jgi:uncharacterized Zn-binding protein involved in type VI secretion
MVPAARKGDPFFCPNHGGGVFEGPCFDRVKIGNAPATRAGDAGLCGCSGSKDRAARGNPTVLIGGAPAVGMMHSMDHGGWVAAGCGNVYIGNPPTDASGNLIPMPRECRFVWRLLTKEPPGNLGRLAKGQQAQTGKETPAVYEFPGTDKPLPAKEVIVTIRGHRVRVVRPGEGVAVQGGVPSLAEVVQGLQTLNDEQLSAVHEVAINPVPNPDDPELKIVYNDPNFVSAATSIGGVVRFYPGSAADPDESRRRENVRGAMQHEAGHAVAQKAWAADPSLKAAWEEARRQDRRNVSTYGAKFIDEDIAEAVLLFALTKGTPCEAAARATFPARYAILERMFPNGYPALKHGVSNGR